MGLLSYRYPLKQVFLLAINYKPYQEPQVMKNLYAIVDFCRSNPVFLSPKRPPSIQGTFFVLSIHSCIGLAIPPFYYSPLTTF